MHGCHRTSCVSSESSIGLEYPKIKANSQIIFLSDATNILFKFST
jgi:hypothetical protein